MAKLQDVRKTIEASFGNLTPVRAQELAKGMLDTNAAKEQVSKTANDLMDWSQRNRSRLMSMVRAEVREQLKQSGVATDEEVRALRKRVRDLERIVKTGGSPGAKRKTTAKRSTAKSAGTAASAKDGGVNKGTSSRPRTDTTDA